MCGVATSSRAPSPPTSSARPRRPLAKRFRSSPGGSLSATNTSPMMRMTPSLIPASSLRSSADGRDDGILVRLAQAVAGVLEGSSPRDPDVLGIPVVDLRLAARVHLLRDRNGLLPAQSAVMQQANDLVVGVPVVVVDVHADVAVILLVQVRIGGHTPRCLSGGTGRVLRHDILVALHRVDQKRHQDVPRGFHDRPRALRKERVKDLQRIPKLLVLAAAVPRAASLPRPRLLVSAVTAAVGRRFVEEDVVAGVVGQLEARVALHAGAVLLAGAAVPADIPFAEDVAAVSLGVRIL
eukprot:scaffold889_cov268-Pinguiococcus_pyrenoidosus.AAC.8